MIPFLMFVAGVFAVMFLAYLSSHKSWFYPRFNPGDVIVSYFDEENQFLVVATGTSAEDGKTVKVYFLNTCEYIRVDERRGFKKVGRVSPEDFKKEYDIWNKIMDWHRKNERKQKIKEGRAAMKIVSSNKNVPFKEGLVKPKLRLIKNDNKNNTND